jgi:hypothetical protein
MTQDRDWFRRDEILSGLEGPAYRGRCAEQIEQLRRHGRARDHPQRLAGDFKRGIGGPVSAHALESRKVGTQPQDLLLVPRAAEPQHADLFFARDGQRIEKDSLREAEHGGGAGGAEREREHRDERIDRASQQMTHRIARVHDPAFEHRSSWSKAIGLRLESGHAAPPSAAQQCRHGSERLTPRPPASGGVSVAAATLRVLDRQLAQHFVLLGDRQQDAKDRSHAERQTPRGHRALVSTM